MLLLVGLAILAVLVAVLLVRSVDQVEVIATLLYVPIFLALLFFGFTGGLVAAIAATIAYVVLRADAIDAVGAGEFTGLIVGRGMAYLLFGIVGGWASSTLELSLEKLDLYDEIDDLTGIRNARFLLGDVDLERSRTNRYQTVFSVSFLEIPAGALQALGRRKRKALLRELGRKLEDGVRTVDRVAHAYDGEVHHVAAVLPETSGTGAAVFHERFVQRIRDFLVANGVDDSVVVTGRTCTIPGDERPLEAQLERWSAVDAAEHATAPT
jgi:GGDEF domain-containing protein